MLIIILLLIGGIVGIAIAAAVRRSGRSERPYPRSHSHYGPGYGRPHGYGHDYYGHPGYGRSRRSGMSAGAAGAIGAVGGGLLGYELGKNEGEQEQFHHDQAMMEPREDYGPYNGPAQGDWMVDQGPGFDDGGDWGWGGDGGDW